MRYLYWLVDPNEKGSENAFMVRSRVKHFVTNLYDVLALPAPHADPAPVREAFGEFPLFISPDLRSQPYCYGHMQRDLGEINARFIFVKSILANGRDQMFPALRSALFPPMLDSLEKMATHWKPSAEVLAKHERRELCAAYTFAQILKRETREIEDWLPGFAQRNPLPAEQKERVTTLLTFWPEQPKYGLSVTPPAPQLPTPR